MSSSSFIFITPSIYSDCIDINCRTTTIKVHLKKLIVLLNGVCVCVYLFIEGRFVCLQLTLRTFASFLFYTVSLSGFFFRPGLNNWNYVKLNASFFFFLLVLRLSFKLRTNLLTIELLIAFFLLLLSVNNNQFVCFFASFSFV